MQRTELGLGHDVSLLGFFGSGGDEDAAYGAPYARLKRTTSLAIMPSECQLRARNMAWPLSCQAKRLSPF
jgi:hypothetical protein